MLPLLAAGFLFPTLVLAQFDLFFPPGLTVHGAHVPVLPPAAPTANIPVARAAVSGPIPAPDSPRPNAGLLKEVYAWRQMDFEYPSEAARAAALANGDFDPTGTLPLGVEVWGPRLFLSLPRWRSGSPATLAWVPRDPRDAGGARSPRLHPYPSWDWHGREDCLGLTSVFRMAVDPCGRLWVLDSGAVDVVTSLRQQCSPQVLVFDLETDELLRRYVLPTDQVKEGSLFSNIVVDVRGDRCEDAVAFLADVWRFGLVTYSLAEDRSWRAEHSYFLPDPLRTDYQLQGLSWTWRDGVFGLALGAEDRSGDRDVFFHSMSSFREFATRASVLRQENGTETSGALRLLPEPRGTRAAQASAAQIDRRGVMFYTLVARNGVGCWNTLHPGGYRTALQGVVAQDNATLVFPNDLKVDQDSGRQSVWVISNRLPFFLYSQLDPQAVNFRIFSAPVEELTAGTVCDPANPPQLGGSHSISTCEA